MKTGAPGEPDRVLLTTWLPALRGLVARRLLIVVVEGRSMEPTLYEGDRLLVRRCAAHRLRPGDVVVLDPPGIRVGAGDRWCEPTDGSQVKRVVAVPGQPVPAGVRSASRTVPAGTVVVFSDNVGVGVDSRAWGPYPARGVVGVVVRRLSPDGGRQRKGSGGDVGRPAGPRHDVKEGKACRFW